MRRHPELAALEPEVLEVAAQMSRTSKDLSVIYSDERVARAKAFLKQRQEEVDAFRDTISLAQASTDEIRRWLRDVEADERASEQQLGRLEKDLREVLPALGYVLDDPVSAEDNVVTIGAKQPAIWGDAHSPTLIQG
jgi:chromosome segregation ATPase